MIITNALSKKLTLYLGNVQGDGEANLGQESLQEAEDSRPPQEAEESRPPQEAEESGPPQEVEESGPPRDTEAGTEGIHHSEVEFNISSCEV